MSGGSKTAACRHHGLAEERADVMARRPRPLRRSMGTASLTNSVLLGQLLFLLVGYSHAFYSDALRWNFCHVSAVLDEPVRAWYCGLSSLLPGAALVALEVCRDAPARRVRTFPL